MPNSDFTAGEKLPLDFDAWRLLQNEKTELVRYILRPGETIEKHGNPVDVCFYILEGEGLLILNDFSYYLKKGDTYFVSKSAEREWINESGLDLEVLVIKYF